ncbi:endolytic transglycosylase MltG, partial [Candidatus Peregrinibacteria bacterium]|nr:endolytic transglycosylase MltG [Candidatus Peregrinibacteria bacterium]
MKKIVILLSALAVLFIIFGYKFYSGAVRYALNPLRSERVIVDIKKGSTASDVAETLYQKGLIKSPLIFRYYISDKGLGGKIKSGRMVLMSDSTLPQIVDTLVSGQSVEMPVTLLEGWTNRQIGEYLEGLGLTTADAFADCSKTCEFKNNILPGGYTEGYLYPDTY